MSEQYIYNTGKYENSMYTIRATKLNVYLIMLSKDMKIRDPLRVIRILLRYLFVS